MKLEALSHRDYTSCLLMNASRVIFKEAANIYRENNTKTKEYTVWEKYRDLRRKQLIHTVTTRI